MPEETSFELLLIVSLVLLSQTARPDRLVFARGSKSACAAVVSHLGRGLCKYIARPDVGVPCDISSGRLSLRALIDPESEAALKYESVSQGAWVGKQEDCI